ncbi:hypothetical protein RRG08_029524 [Elysia crispata]|uniref:Uncharacterized protein n=1 Tax=Elysia crispata TaxID=231223 RepID=A0AAE0XVQ3_9GAST|nr:hypothetical protein RRG08_029524 [Elysia crispata]
MDGYRVELAPPPRGRATDERMEMKQMIWSSRAAVMGRGVSGHTRMVLGLAAGLVSSPPSLGLAGSSYVTRCVRERRLGCAGAGAGGPPCWRLGPPVRYRAGAGPGRPLQDERSIFPQLRRTHLLKGLLQGPDSGAGACEVVVPGVQRCCSVAALTTPESRHKSSIMLLLHMFHGVPVFRLFSSPGDWGAA